MESPPTVKPTLPPKPSPQKTRDLTTAERFFKENPVPRQKPPLAPKPVIPAKPFCSGNQPRLHRKPLGPQVGVSSQKWEQVTHSQTSLSQANNSKLTTVETVHVERIVSTDHENHQTVVTQDSSVVTSVESAECDAERIIQDTWASLQEKSTRPVANSDHSNRDNTNNIFLTKFIQNSSPLFSSELNSELTKVLPLRVKDCVKLTRSNSDATRDSDHPSRETKHTQRPSLQFSPPTPESVTEGDWVLVNKESKSETKLLPSNNNSSIDDSSPYSNSSFLYSVANPNLSKSCELPKSGNEVLSNKVVSSTDNCEVTLRNKKLSGQHSRGASWSEDNEIGRSRTDSFGNESFDGSNSTVRRRISSFFGSFGKGGKTKEKRESSLFYYNPGDDSSQMESSDSGRNSMTSLNDSSILSSNNNVDSPVSIKHTLTVSNECCDGDSNRSSISDESFDAEQNTKSDSTNKGNCSDNVDPVERRKRKCFLIVNELMTSERVFIDVLKLLCHDFKTAVDEASNHQKSPVIPPGDFNKIINNLPQLLSLNEDLLRDIESRIETWNDLPKVADVVVKTGPFLKLYSSYIQNFEAQTDFLDECCERYRKFAQVVRDFEKSDRCKKLALKHYMLKPIQRIPQYRLLLDEYLEHQDPDSPDYEDTQTALKIVCDVANHANRSIKEGDHLSKLLSIQSQLGDYEIIKPGRHFVKEGELYKLCRKDMQQRFFILLSDCLLYTSYYGSMTGLKVKYKLPLAGMKVSRSHSSDCCTEFSIITSTRSFTLRAKSEAECTAWVEALQTSIKDYNTRQMTFLNKQVDPMSLSNESLKIGREAPVWIQDKRVTMCQICTAEFTMTFRRHHCRACGKVVCSACSDYKAPMQYMHFNSDRVCVECYKYLLDEMNDPDANMTEVIKKELKLKEEEEVALKIIEIKSLFKKIGQSSGKKVKKYIPQRLKEVTANDSGSQMSGWLLRKSRTRWKRLWFVLKEQVLYAYKASEDVVASESIPVLGYNLETIPEGDYDETGVESKVLFKLVHPGQPPLVFATDSHSADRWMSALREAITLK